LVGRLRERRFATTMPWRSGTVNATSRPKAESSSESVAHPALRHPDPTGQERRRNVAAVRRWPGEKVERGSRPSRSAAFGRRRRPPGAADDGTAAKSVDFSAIHSRYFACRKVDNRAGRRLYRSSWARRRLARWRVREAPHCSHGDRASGHALDGHVRVAASDVRGSGFSGTCRSRLSGRRTARFRAV
jgi:hypothetical protein